MRISDWSSDVCSSDLTARNLHLGTHGLIGVRHETQASRPRPLRTAPAAGRRHPSCRVVRTQRPAPDGRQQLSVAGAGAPGGRGKRTARPRPDAAAGPGRRDGPGPRREENTSEPQSLRPNSTPVFTFKKTHTKVTRKTNKQS